MAQPVKKILEMNDDELMEWTLTGDAGSYVHQIGETALNMRVATRMLEANREMVNQTKQWLEANIKLDATTKELANQTQSLVRTTRGIVYATWGVVLITFITQVALLYITITHK